jgi:hypothetical protein
MNDFDRENLSFLLNVDKETLKEWYDTVGEDDHLYASELMERYSEELKMKKILITDSKIKNTYVAIDLLRKFTLGGTQ